MPIALDAITTGAADTASFSHTCTGSNRILFVATTTTGADITGVTYNSVALTQIGTSKSDGTRTIQLWYLIAPATGANTVALTGATSLYSGTAISYTGARQSEQPDASTGTAGGASVTRTETVTVVTANSWGLLVTRNDVGTATAGTGSTARSNSALAMDVFDSNGGLAAGSRSMSCTRAEGPNWASIMISFKPPVEVTTTADGGSYSMTGTAMVDTLIMPVASGVFSLTGTAAVLARAIIAASGSFALTGAAMVIKRFKGHRVKGTNTSSISVKGSS